LNFGYWFWAGSGGWRAGWGCYSGGLICGGVCKGLACDSRVGILTRGGSGGLSEVSHFDGSFFFLLGLAGEFVCFFPGGARVVG